MESNKDEAQRCLKISQKHRDAGNLPSARKFAQKSIALFSTPEAVKLLAALDADAASSSSSSSSSSRPTDSAPFSSGAEARPAAAGGAKQRHAEPAASAGPRTGGGGTTEKREYTKENVAVVKRVRGCKVTEYYEILAVKKDCEEAEIKRAYRKVRLCGARLCLADPHVRRAVACARAASG